MVPLNPRPAASPHCSQLPAPSTSSWQAHLQPMGTSPPVPPASPTHGESHQGESAESSSHIIIQFMAVAPMSSWTYEGGRVLVTFVPCVAPVFCVTKEPAERPGRIQRLSRKVVGRGRPHSDSPPPAPGRSSPCGINVNTWDFQTLILGRVAWPAWPSMGPCVSVPLGYDG